MAGKGCGHAAALSPTFLSWGAQWPIASRSVASKHVQFRVQSTPYSDRPVHWKLVLVPSSQQEEAGRTVALEGWKRRTRGAATEKSAAPERVGWNGVEADFGGVRKERTQDETNVTDGDEKAERHACK